ncbi:MAG: tyrosine-type recombinase/integrase [Methylohalobius sp. ZOD2]
MALTDTAIRNTKPGDRDVWLTENARRGEARLTLRITPGGARIFYLRYTNSRGKRELIHLGRYDRDGKKGLTLKAAGERSSELKLLYQQGVRDLKIHLEHEDRRRREELERKRTGTFKSLLDNYEKSLKNTASERDARNIIKNHVRDPFSELCERSASEITPGDIRDILARLIDQGKGRTASKLRSFLLAAFNQAMRAAFDPTSKMKSTGFLIETNPVAATPSLSQFNRARDRVLSWKELISYHSALLEDEGSALHDGLLVALYLGGQRISQLFRLRPENIDLGSRVLVLYDPKGRRHQARPHVLPLINPVRLILERRLQLGDEWIFSDNGKKSVHPGSASRAVARIAGGKYSMGDIRRTCETLIGDTEVMGNLAASKDLRAQIQSHGLNGVQDRHYDRNLYLADKRRILEAWAKRLRRGGSGGKHG